MVPEKGSLWYSERSGRLYQAIGDRAVLKILRDPSMPHLEGDLMEWPEASFPEHLIRKEVADA